MAHKVYSCTSIFGFVKPNVNEILQIAQLMFSNFLIGVRGERTDKKVLQKEIVDSQ